MDSGFRFNQRRSITLPVPDMRGPQRRPGSGDRSCRRSRCWCRSETRSPISATPKRAAAHSFLAAMPGYVLEATLKTESTDWFSAAKRRKTNTANGRRTRSDARVSAAVTVISGLCAGSTVAATRCSLKHGPTVRHGDDQRGQPDGAPRTRGGSRTANRTSWPGGSRCMCGCRSRSARTRRCG